MFHAWWPIWATQHGTHTHTHNTTTQPGTCMNCRAPPNGTRLPKPTRPGNCHVQGQTKALLRDEATASIYCTMHAHNALTSSVCPGMAWPENKPPAKVKLTKNSVSEQGSEQGKWALCGGLCFKAGAGSLLGGPGSAIYLSLYSSSVECGEEQTPPGIGSDHNYRLFTGSFLQRRMSCLASRITRQ